MLIFCPRTILICERKQKKKNMLEQAMKATRPKEFTHKASHFFISFLQKCTRIFGEKLKIKTLNIFILQCLV